MAQQAQEAAELEAQRLHAEARMRERRQAEWEAELRKRGGKAAAAIAAGARTPDVGRSVPSTQALSAAPTQQPAILPPMSMASMPTPVQQGLPARHAVASSSNLPPLLPGMVYSNPPPATTTTGAALPKPRPLPAAMVVDGMRRRASPGALVPQAQQLHPPFPPHSSFRPPLPQPQPPLPQQPPPPLQAKGGGGGIGAPPPLPPQPPPPNQPKRPSQSSSSWGPPPPRGGSGLQQPPLPAGQPPLKRVSGTFDGGPPPLSPTGSSVSAPRSEADFLGGDHTAIPWSDAGAELHQQESLVASMLEGLTSPDGPDLSPTVRRLSEGNNIGDDFSGGILGDEVDTMSAAAAGAFGGMWSAGGTGGGGSFSLWGGSASNVTSPKGDGKRTAFW